MPPAPTSRPSPAAIAQTIQQAKACLDAGKLPEADRLYRGLLRHGVETFDVLMGLGAVCTKRGALVEAAGLLRKAVNQRSGSADAHADLGLALGSMGRVDEAIGRFENALRLRPGCFRSLCNLGSLAAMQGRLEDAIGYFERAIAANPAEPFPRWQKGLALLTLGRFEQGWADYAARPQASPPGAPVWRGERDLAGRTLLLRAEQGMGDMIQFIRYAPLVAALGARVAVEAHAPLIPLLEGAPGVASVHALHTPLPPHDLQCALTSLPGIFWAGLGSLPQAPYLAATGHAAEAWAARLRPASGRRIGVVWSGNPGHRNDRNRSMPLSALRPLLGSGAEILALQKDVKEEDRLELARHPKVRMVGDGLQDFADTAAVVTACDLVISVDTAMAHLAGAIGRPVWVLLPHSPDWRWMLGRADTPWYSTMRLFRQARPGQWDGVVADVLAALGP